MKIFLLPGTFLFLFIHAGAQVNCAVTLTGDTCTQSALIAETNGGTADTLTWYRDSLAIFVSAANGYNRRPSDIARIWDYSENAGLCLDNDTLYLCEDGNSRVTKWAPGTSEGVIVAGGHGIGSRLNQLNYPRGITIDNNHNLYIADCNNGRIMKWLPGATEGIVVASGFKSPGDIFLDKDGIIYISDISAHTVYKFMPGATESIVVAGGHGMGDQNNQLNYPEGITVDDKKNVYVSDSYNARIMKWAPGASEGVVVAGGNDYGRGINQLSNPADIILDKDNNLIISDNGNSRVLLWPMYNSYGITIAGMYGYGEGPLQLLSPGSVALDKENNLIIYESYSGFVKKYLHSSAINNIISTPSETATGMYSVKAHFMNGCTAVSAAVHVNTSPGYVSVKGETGAVCGPAVFYYSVNDELKANTYAWTAPEGCNILSGQGSTHIALQASKAFRKGDIIVQASNGCGSSMGRLHIKSIPSNPGRVLGPITLMPGETGGFKVRNRDSNAYYKWTVPPDVIIDSGQGKFAVKLKWGNTSGYVQATAFSTCGRALEDAYRYVTVSTNATHSNQQSLITEKSNSLKNDILLYPQPASNTVFVYFYASRSFTASMIFTDAAGKTVLQKKFYAIPGKNTVEIDISMLPKTAYFVACSSPYVHGKGKLLIKK